MDSHYLGAEIIYKSLLPDGKIIHSIKSSTERIPVGSEGLRLRLTSHML